MRACFMREIYIKREREREREREKEKERERERVKKKERITRGARKLMVENLKLNWAEFSTLS